MQRITDERKCIISGNEILKMHYLFIGNADIFMCRNLILNKVFENGIQICSGKKKCTEIKLSDAEVSEIWIPFAKDLVDIITCIGVAPIRTKKIDNRMIPYIPKPGSYSIQITTSVDGICTYDLFDINSPMDKPAPNSLVLHGFGYDPRSNGSLCSIIKVLEPTMQFVHAMSDSALTAEMLRCNPPIIVEKKETTQDSKEGLDFDFYMDSDALKTSTHSQYQRDERAVARLKNQQRLFANAINGMDKQSADNTAKTMNNIVPLPSSFRVGTVIEPSGRNDFTQILRSSSESICSVMGVPRSMMISDNVVRRDGEGSHDVFKQCVLLWKNITSKILTLVYRYIYKQDEAERLSKIAKKRKIKDISKLTNNDLIQVVVPVTPYISNDELKQLYLLNLIDWNTYKQYVIRNTSLPIDLLKTNEKDPWSKEDKLLLLGANVSTANDPMANDKKNAPKTNTQKPPKNDKTSTKMKASGAGKN